MACPSRWAYFSRTVKLSSHFVSRAFHAQPGRLSNRDVCSVASRSLFPRCLLTHLPTSYPFSSKPAVGLACSSRSTYLSRAENPSSHCPNLGSQDQPGRFSNLHLCSVPRSSLSLRCLLTHPPKSNSFSLKRAGGLACPSRSTNFSNAARVCSHRD